MFVAARAAAPAGPLHRRRVGADHPLVGTSWALRPDDAEGHVVILGAHDTLVRRLDQPGGPRPDAAIAGSASDLLALLLGRPGRTPLRRHGDPVVAAAFVEAFGGPDRTERAGRPLVSGGGRRATRRRRGRGRPDTRR